MPIPAQLIALAKFCVWKRELRDEKFTKVPYNPLTGALARSNDPTTFSTYAEAIAVLPNYDGLGVGVFDPICAIDIDNCNDELMGLTPMAEDIVRTMNCYTEYSPSGNGLRILFTTRGEYNKDKYYIMNRTLGLEVYVAGVTQKFVTVTGDVIPLCTNHSIEDRTEQLIEVLRKYMVRPDAQLGKGVTGVSKLGDDDLIDIASHNTKFAKLFNGDYSDYPSHSEGDLALFSILAFYANGDQNQMKRILKRSGAIRDKWQRADYMEASFQKAVESLDCGYDPAEYSKRNAETALESFGDADGVLKQWRPDTNRKYAWNDLGNGRLFADWYRDIARYVPERKKWFVFNGKVWVPDVGNLTVMELCKKLADILLAYAATVEGEERRIAYVKHISKWQSRNTRSVILDDAASVYPITLDRFDADPYLFNCRNGTLDLKSGEFHAHRADDLLSKISGVEYRPDAKSERWEKFIEEVMAASEDSDAQIDTDRAQFMQKALGYALTGDTSQECFFLLYGPTTRNGKGTTMETIIRMMGDYGTTCRPDTIAQRKGSNASGPNEDVARLAGARFVNISEPDKRMVLSSALVKTLTGGDTITARYLNENSFEYRPQFKLFVNTNHLPSVTDNTLFTSDRVMTIPFVHHFSDEERDPKLKSELSSASNLSGILNWCLEGLRMLNTQGLNPPESVRLATESYRRTNDKLGRFIDDELEAGPGFQAIMTEVYERYRAWCETNGVYPESSENVKQELGMRMDIKRVRMGSSSTQRTVAVGYKLRTSTMAEFQSTNTGRA